MNVEMLKRLQKLRGVANPGPAQPIVQGLEPALDANGPVQYTPPWPQPSKKPVSQYALPRDRK